MNSTIVRVFRIGARLTSTVSPKLGAAWLERLFLTPRRWPIAAIEEERMASAERRVLRFDSARELPVYTWGNGPPVLLAHGWSGRGSQMSGFVAPLVERGFSVTTFDAPGHGAADGRLSGLPEMASSLELVASHLGQVHAVVAHSLGASATTMALSRGLEVARAVYIAPPENPGDYLFRAAEYLGFSRRAAQSAQALMEKRFGVPFQDAKGTQLASELDVPLLVIHDLRDREVPHDDGQRLAAAWPGSQLMTTNGLGHSRILSDPSVVDAVAGFVTDGRANAARSMAPWAKND